MWKQACALALALEWIHGQFFGCCSLFLDRMMGYSCVIASINIVARTLRAVARVIAYNLQWIEFRFHPAFSIHVYKLTYWLFQCNCNVNHWLNHLCSRKWFNFPSIMEQRERLQHPKPPGDFFNLRSCFGTLYSS